MVEMMIAEWNVLGGEENCLGGGNVRGVYVRGGNVLRCACRRIDRLR